MNNPILDTLLTRLPLISCDIVTLRDPGSPLVLNLKSPGKSGIARREDHEPAEVDVKAQVKKASRNETINIEPQWKDLEELESWIENAAWQLGALDLTRQSWPPLKNPKEWDTPGAGLIAAFCGIDAVVEFVGSNGKPNLENGDLCLRAAREGYWRWSFKPNQGFSEKSLELKAARGEDLLVLPDGSRSAPFPGWIEGPEHRGKSGKWWLGLGKSFETSTEAGHALEWNWDFTTRTHQPTR